MHYKNGRAAVENDPVIGKQYSAPFAGTLHSITPQATTCNGTVAVAIPGGVIQRSVNLSECYHADDAFAAIEAAKTAADETTVASS